MVKLNVLDYAQIDEGSHSVQALRESVELARYAENLGYHRFWVAEHHDVPAFASSSPELLMMHLADHTEQIRIGSGGVMLPHYSPYKVAENFRLLEAAHPHRIDLGIGNTAGTQVVKEALNELRTRRWGYKTAISDVIHYLSGDKAPDFRFGNLEARPLVDSKPDMWLLSTSVSNAKLAARLGIGYCFGLFPYASGDKLEVGREACRVYREEFQPSAVLSEPRVMFSMFAAASTDDEHAEALAKSIDLWMLGQEDFSKFKQIPSIETAEQYQLSAAEERRIKANRSRLIVGGPESIRQQLDVYIEAFKADELLMCTIMPGIENRKKGLEVLAQAFNI